MLNRRESWILSIKTFVHCKCNIKIDLDFYVRVCTFLQKTCNWKTALSDNCVNCTETFLFKILRKNYIKDNWKILCVSLLPNQWLHFKLLKMQTKRTKKCWSGQLCLLYYQWLHHQVLILKLWGEAAGICLSPIQVSCIAGFSWPPWQSSCNKRLVFRLVFPSSGKSSFDFITAVTVLTKTTKQPKIWSHLHEEGFSSVGNVHAAHLWGCSAPKRHP